ncbi:MFS transporter [Consotaella salsifontis]|uniref:Sugar phosphate permease n=1 Tax=Consotaella salsifontis TaxID=1365950 RepID=A0A1T4RXT3_9HYPH|nr:MFS transporter [Consotaella salsifontis]SKA20676.1 Sugar phosphate permease [Consotaella salsifontis]
MQSFGRFVVINLRWIAAGFLLTFFSSVGQTFFIALSNAEIRSAFALSNGGFGGLYMIATLCSAATLPFMGRLLDRYSTFAVTVGSLIALAAAALALGLVWSIPSLVFALYLLRLFGQGMMTEIAFTATGRWFAANRGRAVALATLGQRAGEGLLPFVFVAVAAAIGWRNAWLAAAVAVLALALPLIGWLVRRERNPKGEASSHEHLSARDWTASEVLRDPKFYAICLGVLAPAFIGTTVFFHQVYLTEIKGWSLQLFAAGFAVMSVTNVFFSLLSGWLIDRYSSVRFLPSFLLPMALACFVVAWMKADWTIFLFMALLGISYGFSSTLSGAMWPEIYGTRHLGAIRSLVVSAMVIATAIGPGLTGWLIDIGVDFEFQLAVMGIYSLAAAALMALVSRRLMAERVAA